MRNRGSEKSCGSAGMPACGTGRENGGGFFARRYGLSDSGARVFRRGVIWSAWSNVANLAPVAVLFMAMVDLLAPVLSGQPYAVSPWKYLVSCALALIFIGVAQRRKYRATFCDTYEESSRKRISIAERLRLLPLSFFGERDLADLTTVIMTDAEGTEHAMSHALPQFWGMLASTALVAVLLAICDWRMALACLWVVPVSLGLVFVSRKLQDRKGAALNAERLASSSAIQETIECASDIRACNRQELVAERLQARFESVEKSQGRYELVASVVLTSARVFLQLGIATTLLAGAGLYASGELPLTMFVLFMLVATRIYDPVTEMLMNVLEIFAAGISSERLAAIEHHPVAEGSTSFEPENYDITFEHVSFSYDRKTPVLEDVSFTARQGEVTALVGPSGSGKTTVSKLAARLWDAQEGRIALGGVDVSSVDPEVLLGSFSEVFQDVVLFSGTVKENILVGRRDADDDEVLRAARAAQCTEFIDKLPDGIDTGITENGSSLSGGQRQRISIARALLKDAPIVLLDEATASLDPESETRVQEAIAALTKDKTVLMVAHRMRTVMHADHIVVLDQGRVVEDGTPSELLSRDGLFARLCKLQGVRA